LFRKIKLLIVALIIAATSALGLGALSGGTAFADSDCGSSYAYGSRVCLDLTAPGGGQLVVVYDYGNHVYNSFYVTADPNLTPSVFSASEWMYLGNYQTSVRINNWSFMNSYDWNYYGTGVCYGSGNMCANSSQHDLLEWFANSAGFEWVTAS
jgi:hypothetical protein